MKKSIYLDRFMLRRSFRNKVLRVSELKVWTKKSCITSCFPIGSRIQVYNGSKFINLTLAREMQGYVLGSFV